GVASTPVPASSRQALRSQDVATTPVPGMSPPVVRSQDASTAPVPVFVPTSSQSARDAARDGVVQALAALPLGQRLDAAATAETAEGRWVVSTPDQVPAEA